MDIFEKSLLLLDEYFSETSPSMVEESMRIVDNMNVDGPTVTEYFSGFESEFHYKEWLQISEKPSFQTFNDNRKVTWVKFNVRFDNSPYGKTHFESKSQVKFFAIESRKQAAW